MREMIRLLWNVDDSDLKSDRTLIKPRKSWLLTHPKWHDIWVLVEIGEMFDPSFTQMVKQTPLSALFWGMGCNCMNGPTVNPSWGVREWTCAGDHEPTPNKHPSIYKVGPYDRYKWSYNPYK